MNFTLGSKWVTHIEELILKLSVECLAGLDSISEFCLVVCIGLVITGDIILCSNIQLLLCSSYIFDH